MVKRKTLAFINYSYVFATFLVILGHSTPTSQSDMPKFAYDIRAIIYYFHMPLFFFIAGLLLVYTKGEHREAYGKYIKKKATRLLLPYLFLTVLGFFPKLFLSSYVNYPVAINPQSILHSVFSPQNNFSGHAWFLPVLFGFYALGYLFLDLKKSRAASLCLTVLLVAALFLPKMPSLFGISDLLKYGIYFWMGIITCRLLIDYKDKLFKISYSLVLLLVAVAFAMYLRYNFIIVPEILKMIFNSLMFFIVLSFAFTLEKSAMEHKLLDYLNERKFTIYILSWAFQSLTEIALNRILHCHWYITIFCMFLTGFLGPILILTLLNKFKINNKWINRCIGNG
ncbi:hypothetical protein AGMMS50284_0180 [Clostridia bacterium]|nr:hypothetical protein AGMMS50284_0180 [Clostridia bacterium]